MDSWFIHSFQLRVCLGHETFTVHFKQDMVKYNLMPGSALPLRCCRNQEKDEIKIESK